MQEINYYVCNRDSLVLAALLAPAMAISIIALKVVALSAYYNSIDAAVPAYFFFGDKRAVRGLALRAMTKNPKETESFVSAEDSDGYAKISSLTQPVSAMWRTLRTAATKARAAHAAARDAMDAARARALRDAAEIADGVAADFLPGA
jgi:hypothetical protein